MAPSEPIPTGFNIDVVMWAERAVYVYVSVFRFVPRGEHVEDAPADLHADV